MIFGSCPYCDHSMVFHVGYQRTPYWGHEICDACGKTFWEEYSRFNPRAMSEEEFAKEHSVDREKHTITQNPSPIGMPVRSGLKEDLDAIADKILRESADPTNEGGQ